MAGKKFKLDSDLELYIRLPENREEDEQITLTIPRSFAQNTILVKFVWESEVPFGKKTIKDTDYRSKAEVDFVGTEEEWGAKEESYEVVEANPICRPEECPEGKGGYETECHDMGCGICNGNVEYSTMKVKRLVID